MSDSRLSVRMHAVCAALAAVFVAHYLMSAGEWGFLLVGKSRLSGGLIGMHVLSPRHQAAFLRFAALFLGSMTAYLLARRAKRSTPVAIVALFLISGLTCEYEISNRIAQVRWPLTLRPAYPVGPPNQYMTWWWYKWWLYHDHSFNILDEVPRMFIVFGACCMSAIMALFDCVFLYRRDAARHTYRALFSSLQQALFEPSVLTQEGLRFQRWILCLLVVASVTLFVAFAWIYL